MPVKSLRDAIEESIKIAPNSYGSEAFVTMSMHDAEGPVLYGISRPIFVADLPPRGVTATIGGGSKTTGIGHWFTKQPTPGYTSRNSPYGYGQADYYLSSQKFDAGYQQPFVNNQRVAMDFSVRRDPGIPVLHVDTWRAHRADRDRGRAYGGDARRDRGRALPARRRPKH